MLNVAVAYSISYLPTCAAIVYAHNIDIDIHNNAFYSTKSLFSLFYLFSKAFLFYYSLDMPTDIVAFSVGHTDLLETK